MTTDREAIVSEAYATHRAALVRRLTAMTRHADVAEDIAQEAYLRLSAEVAAGRTPDDVAAWLHRVAANLVASRGRHQSVVDRRAGELPLPGQEESPEREAVRHELDEAVRVALAALPADDRRALVLAAHGYRGPEIASRLRRTNGATRTLLCRARSKMRAQLLVAGFASL
jgi:RNA polymerase sigma factor (sigma-70 family)